MRGECMNSTLADRLKPIQDADDDWWDDVWWEFEWLCDEFGWFEFNTELGTGCCKRLFVVDNA